MKLCIKKIDTSKSVNIMKYRSKIFITDKVFPSFGDQNGATSTFKENSTSIMKAWDWSYVTVKEI